MYVKILVHVHTKALSFGFFLTEALANDLRSSFVKFKTYNKEEYNLKRSLTQLPF